MADEFLRYIRPDEIWSAMASVSSGDLDADYPAAWLCDLQPSYPIRTTGGNLSATITNTFDTIDVIALFNHNLLGGTGVTIGGDVAASLTAPTVPADGVPLGFYGFAGSPSAGDSITVAIAGHATDIIIGELVAGALRTIRLPLLSSHQEEALHKNIVPPVDLSSVMPYDKGIAFETFGGTFLVTEAEMLDLKAWWQAQRGLSRPSVIIPDPSVNIARLVSFATFRAKPIVSHQDSTPRIWTVDLLFEEYGRSRW